ncbi:precorrin-2 C(20)-methyltransferase [Pedobacter hartonius]|uniref:Cobalt-factor II C20-methyltransferase n=1 Tax=Pedobacter hartonius TaxID=425514 RepID=A0A1H4EU03_9SPHI|nr:precorrin-2 C(20)-methyltransferase [Pedobacter hartonius]SEA88491.1 cobalt-factor II C20-methyltransferase [Pedobacter hartonius]
MEKIYGISLGPGDPELITLKGLNILKEADVIFYPGSLFKDGRKESYVRPMLDHYGLEPNRLKGFFLSMGPDRTAAETIYRETADQMLVACKEGKKVSLVCEGDLSFYASFSYLLEKLQAENITLELVPGVNSFSLGAAIHQVPLCLQQEKLAVLPLATDIGEIEHTFEDFDTVILMKIRMGWTALYPQLLTKTWKYYYCERLGTADEYITADIAELQDREIPYFSLLIIKK